MAKRPMYEKAIIERIKELSEQKGKILIEMETTIREIEAEAKTSLKVIERTITELRQIIGFKETEEKEVSHEQDKTNS